MARVKNEQYLDRLAIIVCDYHGKKRKLPRHFDDALSESGQTLPNRGDYYGRSYHYLPFQDTAFFFRAHDVEVSYVNCKKVSHAEFVKWVRTHSDPDEYGLMEQFYDP
ncbi:MAG: hypothetical protein ABI680_20245 [Chthoniobacteraceae bacterium]